MTNGEYLLLAVVSLQVIVSPISLVPIFLALTPDNSPRERVRMAGIACVMACLTLLLFAFTGQLLFKVLGVSMEAFQIAGGALLFIIALEMLRQGDKKHLSEDESAEAAEKDDIAVSPMAVPLLVGPGSISTVVLLQTQADGPVQHAILYGSVLVVMLSSFVILRVSAAGTRFVNPLLMRLVSRLSGLLLAAIAVQFIVNGLRQIGFIASQ